MRHSCRSPYLVYIIRRKDLTFGNWGGRIRDMKYKAVVAILDGQPDLSGDILTNNVRMPESNIPVTLNFEKPPIGIATVKMEDNKIVAEIDIYDINVTSELVETFSGVVGGSIFRKKRCFY